MGLGKETNKEVSESDSNKITANRVNYDLKKQKIISYLYIMSKRYDPLKNQNFLMKKVNVSIVKIIDKII
jgi:hypothetical protein